MHIQRVLSALQERKDGVSKILSFTLTISRQTVLLKNVRDFLLIFFILFNIFVTKEKLPYLQQIKFDKKNPPFFEI